tara:strand:+ start:131 stop:529 length:399 start_codon:yes stop_codon:yes gene_type:complete
MPVNISILLVGAAFVTMPDVEDSRDDLTSSIQVIREPFDPDDLDVAAAAALQTRSNGFNRVLLVIAQSNHIGLDDIEDVEDREGRGITHDGLVHRLQPSDHPAAKGVVRDRLVLLLAHRVVVSHHYDQLITQ